MRSRLLNDVSMLASRRFQERYVVNGTKEQYAIPEEILEAALSSARTALGQKSPNSALSATEANAAIEFIADTSDAVSNLDLHDFVVTNNQLIEQDERWAAARTAAGRLLAAFGYDLAEWERQEGLT
jgi:hypothetical protein